MQYRKKNYLSFGIMTLLVGGLALFGLLAYGWVSGQELPFWPALAVALVNIVAALRLVKERKAMRRPPDSKNTDDTDRPQQQ